METVLIFLGLMRRPQPETRKTLSYECQRALIEYMEPNKRFRLSRCSPAFHQIDRLVPLKLDRLCFGQMEASINCTNHQFGIHREFHKNHKTPKQIDHENRMGGARYDMDQYGFAEHPVVLPADLDLYDGSRHPRPTREANRRRYEALRELEHIRNSRDVSEENALRFVELLRMGPPIDESEKLSLTLEAEHLRAPYDSSLQYIRMLPVHVEETPYTPGSLLKTYRKHLHGFFGGRDTIEVRRLEIEKLGIVIPLPPGIKFKVRELIIPRQLTFTLKELSKVLDKSSFPLDLLVVGWDSEGNFKNPVVRNSKSLVIKGSPWRLQNPRQFFGNLPSDVHMVSRRSSIVEYGALIRYWLEIEAEIGRRFTMGFEREVDLLETMNLLREDMNGVGERSFVIPMNPISEILVRCEYMDPNLPNSYRQSHLLRIEVIPVGEHPPEQIFPKPSIFWVFFMICRMEISAALFVFVFFQVARLISWYCEGKNTRFCS